MCRLCVASWVLAWFVASAAPLASASTAPPVEELVVHALARAPSVAAARANLAAARAAVAPAAALPDPMAELELQDVDFPEWTVGRHEMSMVRLAARQDLPFPGKRDARRNVATADAAVAAAELELVRREIVLEVRRLYAGLYAVDAEQRLLADSRELLEMLAATAVARYSVGETPQEAVLRAQLELTLLGEREDELAADRVALVAALARLLERPPTTPLGAVERLPLLLLPDPRPEPAEAAPEVAVRRRAADAARARVAAAEKELRPDLFAGAGLGLRGGLDTVVSLGVGIELPLWRRDKQLALVEVARHELAAEEARLADAVAAAAAEVATLEAALERVRRQVERYREGVLPQSSAAIDAARVAYLAGSGDFATVLDDFRLWLDARATLSRREAELFATTAALDAVLRPAPPFVEQEP